MWHLKKDITEMCSRANMDVVIPPCGGDSLSLSGPGVPGIFSYYIFCAAKKPW